MPSSAYTSFLGLVALCIACGGANCEEPQPVTPVCTSICPDTPVVFEMCEGRRIYVPNGWKHEEYEP